MVDTTQVDTTQVLDATVVGGKPTQQDKFNMSFNDQTVEMDLSCDQTVIVQPALKQKQETIEGGGQVMLNQHSTKNVKAKKQLNQSFGMELEQEEEMEQLQEELESVMEPI